MPFLLPVGRSPRCVIPKDRPEPGWPGWVTVLNRTGGPITVLVTFQGKKNPAMEREIGPDEEYVRKCQLVSAGACKRHWSMLRT